MSAIASSTVSTEPSSANFRSSSIVSPGIWGNGMVLALSESSRSDDQRGSVPTEPARALSVVGAVACEQRPEPWRVVHHLEMADLVPDDVVEDRLGGQQQPPVEAHRAARRAAGPAGALGAGW